MNPPPSQVLLVEDDPRLPELLALPLREDNITLTCVWTASEVFALVRETFNIPRQDTVKLRDYPTLRRVVGFVKENRPDLGGAAAASVSATAITAITPACTGSVTTRSAACGTLPALLCACT